VKVIAVDWSGAADTRGQRSRIWAATVLGGRLTDLSNGRTRDEVVDFVVREASSSGTLVVGLDFSFSLPAWFVRGLGVADAGALWELVAAKGEAWLRDCRPPFWGRPGSTRPPLPCLYRSTESACLPVAGIAPKSTFQIGGAGSVGTGSIRGMPHLRSLREAGFAIWPFDPPGRLTVVEIYPRALTGPVNKSDRRCRAGYLRGWEMPEAFRRRAEGSEDAFDAAVSALVAYRHAPEVAGLRPADDPDVRLEGAMWVPGGWRDARS
jgi:hypothetical protein